MDINNGGGAVFTILSILLAASLERGKSFRELVILFLYSHRLLRGRGLRLLRGRGLRLGREPLIVAQTAFEVEVAVRRDKDNVVVVIVVVGLGFPGLTSLLPM